MAFRCERCGEIADYYSKDAESIEATGMCLRCKRAYDKEFKKVAKEAMHCPICGGRPILHSRLCMRRIKKVV